MIVSTATIVTIILIIAYNDSRSNHDRHGSNSDGNSSSENPSNDRHDG